MLSCVLLLSVWLILLNVPCELEKNMYSAIVEMTLSIDINHVQLIDFIVQSNYVISDFRLSESAHF